MNGFTEKRGSVNGTDEKKDNLLGLCNACRKPSNLQCSICNDSYCSTKCQRFDFRRHRYICFPMPSLIPYREYHNNELINEEERTCENCKIESSKCCEKCGFAYCSVRCQLSNWEYHRYICFPMPKLVRKTLEIPKHDQISANNIDNKNSKTYSDTQNATNKCNSVNKTNHTMQSSNNNRNKERPINCVTPDENAKVIFMGFSSSNRVYVRCTSDEIDKHFKEIIKKVNDIGKKGDPLSVMPKKKIVHALAQFDDEWYRVFVLEIREDNQLRVLLIDLGEIRVCKLQQMKEIPQDILALKQYTVLLKLRNVPFFKMNEKLNNFLSNYIGAMLRVKYRNSDNYGCTAELYVEDQKKSLNERIIEVYKADQQFGKTEHDDKNKNNKTNTITADPKPFKMLKLNDNVTDIEAALLDHSNISVGYIGCIPVQYTKTLLQIQEYTSKIDDQTPYKPKLHEYCLGNYGGEWYRAQCNKIKGPDSFNVIYLDFTNEATLTSDDIRKYPADFNIDCNTIICFIRNLPKKLNQQQIEFATEFFDNVKFIKLNNIELLAEPFYAAEYTDLIEKMQKAQLLD